MRLVIISGLLICNWKRNGFELSKEAASRSRAFTKTVVVILVIPVNCQGKPKNLLRWVYCARAIDLHPVS